MRVERATDFGYPYEDPPDCNEQTDEYCMIDRWDLTAGQCTSWVAFRLHRLDFDDLYAGVRWGDARDWATSALRAELPVLRQPAIGTVAWWAHGHVAYVEQVAPGRILISEMNYDGHNRFRRVWIRDNERRWPDAFIYMGFSRAAAEPARSNREVQA